MLGYECLWSNKKKKNTYNPWLKKILKLYLLFCTPCSGFVKNVARPDYWVPDQDITQCHQCSKIFTAAMSKHHCRACGQGVCDSCSTHIRPVPSRGWDHPVRVCDSCHARTDNLWHFKPGELLKGDLVFYKTLSRRAAAPRAHGGLILQHWTGISLCFGLTNFRSSFYLVCLPCPTDAGVVQR